MQPEANNHIFHKGLKDSIDISKLKNDTWTFPTLNVHLINKAGQGYIVTPQKGNTVNDGSGGIGGKDNVGAVLKVATDYIILAAEEFNGVLYIISAKNDGLGQGEIGVYPAPSSLIANPTAGVTPSVIGWPAISDVYPYGRFYAPLGNFNAYPNINPAVYDITATYVIGDYVQYINPATNSNDIYIAIANSAVPAGAFVPGDWTLAIHIYSPTYTIGYVVGNTVIYNNHTYQGVVNTGVNPGPFDPAEWTIVSHLNSTAFSFWFENMTEIEIRPHYDDSVNLYITDYKNPNRVVNSGFDMNTGELTGTIYSPMSFLSTFNQILGTSKELVIDTVRIIPTGVWKYGNVFFYLRYMNASLDKSDVITVSNACQVYDGDIALEYSVEGGDGADTSNKQIILELDASTIDTSYTYINVVYTRYYSDATGIQIWETFEIAQPYLISQIIADGGLISIFGDEDILNISEAELLTIRGIENVCKTQTQFANRWWGGNWKGPVLHDDALAEFFKLIKITYDDLTEREAGPVERLVSAEIPPDAAHSQYDEYKDTYDYVGYFRGEIYAFAGIGELMTGQQTEAYPLWGVDNYFNNPPDYTVGGADRGNKKGIYRFPPTTFSNPYPNGGDKIRLLGVKFDMTAANAYLAAATGDWVKANVRGIYFVRADRKATLKYQGLMMPASRSYLCYEIGVPEETPIEYTTGASPAFNISVIHQDSVGTKTIKDIALGQHSGTTTTWLDVCNNPTSSYGQFVGKVAGAGACTNNEWAGEWDGNTPGNTETKGGSDDVEYNDLYFPIYRGYMPEMYYNNSTGWRYYQNRWYHRLGKNAFYSPDYLFDAYAVIEDQYWVKHVARTQDFSFDNWLQRDADSFGGTLDLRPYAVIAEVKNGYKCDIANLLAIEQCDTYDVGRLSDVYPDAVLADTDYYVNAGGDYTDPNGIGAGDRALWYAYKDNLTNHQRWSTRSIRAAKYLGINTNNDLPPYGGEPDILNYRLSITNIYDNNIEDASFDISTWYSIFSLPYYKISPFIKLFDDNMNVILDNSYTFFKGDCFLQRFYFKQAAFNCSAAFTAVGDTGISAGTPLECHVSDSEGGPVFDSSDCENMRYAFGTIIGIVIECSNNLNMRYHENSEYYPHTEAYIWNAMAQNGLVSEKFLLNTGHNRTLDLTPVFMYNSALPHVQNKHLTRIRFSDEHQQYSIVDGYRNILPLAYKDYDSSRQQIMKIIEFNNELMSVQEDVINRHFTVEKNLTASVTSGEIALGSGEILSPITRRVSDYGTQHQSSVIRTKNGVYGVDAFRRIIWRAKMSTTTTGSYVMGGDELSKSKYIEKWVYDWFDEVQPLTDKPGRIADTPLLGYGIASGYDPKYKDVYFSFLNHEVSNTSPLAYTILGITEFNNKWNAAVDYYLPYEVVFNEADSNWYYSKIPVTVPPTTTNIGHQPNLYPLYWALVDFASAIPYTTNMNVTAGQLIRCCLDDTAFDCANGKFYLVTANQSTVETCTELSRSDRERVLYNELNIRCCNDRSKTLIFNEEIDEFKCESSLVSVIYASIYSDFFTAGDNVLTHSSYMWRNDMPDYLWYYGGEREMQLSFYENGNTETATESMLTKYFESQDVHGSEKELWGVTYETEYQEGEHFPYINEKEFWRSPEYLEHHWKIPVMVKENADDQDFDTESSMQGTWLKTTLRYKQKVETFIKNVTTSYRKSSV